MSNAASIGSKTFHDLATNHTYRSETDIVKIYPSICKIWIFHNHSIFKKRPVKALMVTIIVISSVLACPINWHFYERHTCKPPNFGN